MRNAIIFSVLLVAFLALPVAAHYLTIWEQANGFPYGRMCDYFSLTGGCKETVAEVLVRLGL